MKDGLELACRFALPPNSKSYCGKPSFRRAFAKYLEDRNLRNRHNLERELEKFVAHNAYLSLIASCCGLHKFDWRVADAFWIGNALLEQVGREKIAKMIERSFSKKGMLSASRAKALAKGIPDRVYAHHSFHVFYLHSISGAVKPSLKNADSCRISWGRVACLQDGKAILESQRIAKKNGKVRLERCKKAVLLSCQGIPLAENIRKGDWLACHWGYAVLKITRRQAQQLERYTKANLGLLSCKQKA
ncbi:MAG: DUF6390 family protein [Candidatus Anstonellaceae archaeon]